MAHDTLLDPDEPSPFTVSRLEGSSNFVLFGRSCELAHSASPRGPGLTGIGIEAAHCLDIGALAVAERVAGLLDAALIAQNYSRLVIDLQS